jgi:hypothetical protein
MHHIVDGGPGGTCISNKSGGTRSDSGIRRYQAANKSNELHENRDWSRKRSRQLVGLPDPVEELGSAISSCDEAAELTIEARYLLAGVKRGASLAELTPMTEVQHDHDRSSMS